MIRFIQTGDVHLDTRFSGIRDQSKRRQRREEHRWSFRKIMEITGQTQPDFLLITGDLFEHERFSPDTINFIIQQLERIHPLKVFIIAGNHDHLVSGSPYLTYEWPDNVHIFTNRGFERVEMADKGVVIHAVSVTPQNRPDYLLKGYVVPKDERIHIVMFHGSETTDRRSMELWGDCLPFTREDVLSCGADYYALGHYHSLRPVPFQEADVKGFYAGCPEPTKFTETGERYIIQVELEKGRPVQKNEIRDQQGRRYREEIIRCDGFKTRDQILEKIRALSDREAIVKIVLDGYTDPDLELDLQLIREKTEDWFFASEIEDRTQPDYRLDRIDNLLAIRFHEEVEAAQKLCQDPGEIRLLEEAEILGLDALLRREVRRYEA
ncbi:MAG TPA: DNA repair exonuclease [Candidatus Latescibacteria bacterium]|nr:DNA repair exonuclease [Candidatus Latescibacterota bacterium]